MYIIVHIPSSVGLILAGKPFNALDIMLSQCGWCRLCGESWVWACVHFLHRAIARSDTRCVVRAYTCVTPRSCPYVFLSRYTPQDRKIGRTVCSFEVFYFKLLDPEILSAASSILRPLNILHSSAKKYPRTTVPCCRVAIFYSELLDPEIWQITHRIKYFEICAQHGTYVKLSQKSAEI